MEESNQGPFAETAEHAQPVSSFKSRARYSTVSIALHWIIAAAIIGNIVAAVTSKYVSPLYSELLIHSHKSVGITVLVLSFVRLGWRLHHGVPPLPASLEPWEKAAAQSVHATLYALMILVPLLGWAMSSAGPWPMEWFGLPFPKVPITRDPKSLIAVTVHKSHVVLGLTFGGLALVHMAGALKHQILDGKNEISRMWPPPRRVLDPENQETFLPS